MRRCRQAAAALLTCLFALAAHADFSVEDYLIQSAKPETAVTATIYVTGVGWGIVTANAQIQRLGNPPLFCPPEDMPMNGYFFVSMLDAEIKDRVREGTLPPNTEVAHVLLFSLIKRLPCK